MATCQEIWGPPETENLVPTTSKEMEILILDHHIDLNSVKTSMTLEANVTPVPPKRNAALLVSYRP